MCDYTQVEYLCQHFRWTVLKWCEKYERSYKRCPPNIKQLEVRNNEKCSDCKPPPEVAWGWMIKRDDDVRKP
ncbi:hypothetical protein F5Y16DRAFT_392310 [Xylariaceae sp. FL0255]|nr:hypothetical protein F5Y16DRAFT_392310 [Xylariaceae sp. FL0255]